MMHSLTMFVGKKASMTTILNRYNMSVFHFLSSYSFGIVVFSLNAVQL